MVIVFSTKKKKKFIQMENAEKKLFEMCHYPIIIIMINIYNHHHYHHHHHQLQEQKFFLADVKCMAITYTDTQKIIRIKSNWIQQQQQHLSTRNMDECSTTTTTEKAKILFHLDFVVVQQNQMKWYKCLYFDVNNNIMFWQQTNKQTK